jgi:cyclophilin family peptidyl-prolyl cis-trans isomerase
MPIQSNRCLLALFASLALVLAAGCGGESNDTSSPPVSTGAPAATATPPADTTAGGTAANAPGASGAAAGTEATRTAAAEDLLKKYGKKPVVVIQTSLGTIKVQLDGEKAPLSTENFLKYVESGHYTNTVFHRVISDFMIQGGGFTADLTEKETREPVKNEAGNGVKNARGTIAMARTSDPDSATSQFFINVEDNGSLDRGDPNAVDAFGYTVFGKVTSGMDVVDKIRKVKTGVKNRPDGAPMRDVPVTPVVIKSITVEKKAG